MDNDHLDHNKSKILTVIRQLTQLMIDRDITGLKNILDENFTLTHITGYKQSGEEWFTEIKNEGMKYYSYKEVKTSVVINGRFPTLIV
jgi:hypothetical protein